MFDNKNANKSVCQKSLNGKQSKEMFIILIINYKQKIKLKNGIKFKLKLKLMAFFVVWNHIKVKESFNYLKEILKEFSFGFNIAKNQIFC